MVESSTASTRAAQLVLDGPFIPGGEEEQQGGQRQAEHDGDVIAALGGVT